MSFFKKNNKDNLKVSLKVAKTVQDTIPYKKVHEKESLIEINDNEFARTYLLEDINFSTAKEEDQIEIFVKYQSLINSLPHNVRFQISIINKNIDKKEFRDNVLMKYKHDSLDAYRKEMNDIVTDKISEGKNNLIKQKLITISLVSEDVKQAEINFREIDKRVIEGVRDLQLSRGSSKVRALRIEEYLEIIHDIYNIDYSGQFNEVKTIDGKESYAFTFENMQRMGLTTKDLVGPESFQFKFGYFKSGEKYGRALYINKLPSYLGTKFINSISGNEENQIVSLSFEPLLQGDAVKMIKGHIAAINAQRIEKQKRGAKAGYDADLVSVDLLEASDHANEFLRDMQSRNQKLYYMTGVIVIFADSEEELDQATRNLTNIASSYLVDIKRLNNQQEQGFSQAMPLARNDIKVRRTVNSEAAAVFMPFDTEELSDPKGLYYGVNATSRNLLMYNRKNAQNQNGFVLGVPGSGKSFISKIEMTSVLLNTNDDIIIIDPESEYGGLAEMLGGSVVPISIGSDNYVNPFDMLDGYSGDDTADPIAAKTDFITSIVETIVADKYTGLSAIQKSIIDRTVKATYEPYIEKLNQIDKKSLTEDQYNQYCREISPTFIDFRNILMSQKEAEARQMAISIEQYTIGSLNIFAKRTNVDNTNRFTVYDISNVGSNMMPLAMTVLMDSIWNRILENRNKGKSTWIYIDEIYLMFKDEASVSLLEAMWKRARKYGGIPSGITQNVEDLLATKAAQNMLSNCEFVLMMNQAPLDREKLAPLLNISETQLSYITNSESGHGLLYTGTATIPFVNQFPHDTELYKVMTTKLSEITEYKKKEELE